MAVDRARTRRPRKGHGFAFTLTRSAIAGAALALWLPTLQADSVSPELQQRIRATTYEVVVRKAEPDYVAYEKPLPLELVPFAERSDAYWSIGSAFALAPGVFASAAHLINASIGSPFGVPALRDVDGKVYALDQILKYSLEEDFVVFSVRDAPQVTPLEALRDFARDAPVVAVGNALGEGIVVRDGLLTSTTPEAREGRWNWLRFSAASSPGNSGGPLLDADGRILGIVIGKSPNENLNFALPIARVLDDPGHEARFELRASFAAPILRDPAVADFRTVFELPTSYEQFTQRYLAAVLAYYREQHHKILAEQADELFPRGESAALLATVHKAETPGLVAQKEDGTWHVNFGMNKQDTTLPSGVRIRTASIGNITVFRLQSGTAAPASLAQTDSRALMDDLLRALRLPRLVGSQPIRITSLGPATGDQRFTDGWARPWQLRTWSLGFVNMSLLVATLPTPDGVLGMLRLVAGQELAVAGDETRFLADYFYLSYSGTLPQWRSFLDARAGRPRLFDELRWQSDPARGFHYQSGGLDVLAPPEAVPLTDDAILDLRTTYTMQGERLAWQVAELQLSQDTTRKTWLALSRQFPPPPASEPSRLADWDEAQQRTGRYTGVPQYDKDSGSYWLRTTVGDAATAVYELTYRTNRQMLPRQMNEIRDELLRNIRVGDR